MNPRDDGWMSGLLPANPVRQAVAGTAAGGFDPPAPRLARAHGYWLGGKDHFPADRMVAGEAADNRPHDTLPSPADLYAGVARASAGKWA